MLRLIAFLFSLSVSGPRQAEVFEAYSKLPSIAKDIHCSLTVVPYKDWQEGDNTLGVYYIFLDKILIRGDLDPETFKVCVAHEYGHHVFYNKFTPEMAKDWKWRCWIGMASKMPRDYCWSAPEEAWAECYATRFVGTKSYLYKNPLDPDLSRAVDRFLKWTQQKSEPSFGTSSEGLRNTGGVRPNLGILTRSKWNPPAPGGPGFSWGVGVAARRGVAPRP